MFASLRACSAIPGSPRHVRNLALSLTGVVAVALAAQTAAAETRGYAITWFQAAYYYGNGDCPEGPQIETDFKALFERQGKTPEEIKDLLGEFKMANPKFRQSVLNRGANGANVCANPESIPDPGFKTVKGKIAYGMNLDGTTDGHATGATCGHQKFVSPDGQPAVDNQLYRVMGCTKSFRAPGHGGLGQGYMNERMRTEGVRTYLMEISGVDPSRNDYDVEIGIYLGTDPLMPDATDGVLPYSTQRIGQDPRWHNHAHGHVHDGVLTTDEFDLNLLADPIWLAAAYHFQKAHLRLELKPDGTATGFLAGYHDWHPFSFNQTEEQLNTEAFNSGSCPGTYYAFKRLADGLKDPVTGECNGISATFGIEAVPAFVVHPPVDGKKTAQAEQPVRSVAAAAR